MNIPSSEQNDLLTDLKDGGEERFAEHFLNVKERLKKIAWFRLDGRLRGRVSESDVVQETYVRAAQRVARYLADPQVPFFVWLRAELHQKLVEIHRQHFNAAKRDIRLERQAPAATNDQTSIALAAQFAAQLTSASQVLERAEQIELLEKAIAGMNEMDREVIALRHFEELTNTETADVLGIETSAASKRYLRALKRIREIFHSIDGSTS